MLLVVLVPAATAVTVAMAVAYALKGCCEKNVEGKRVLGKVKVMLCGR